MTLVIQFKDGNLYCIDCGERIKNTANFEMKQAGSYAYSHSCKPNKSVRDRLKNELFPLLFKN